MTNEIESLLGRMPLRKPAASMDARVFRARRPARRVLWGAAVGGAVGAAAAVLLVALGLFPRGGAARHTTAPAPAPKTPAVAKASPAPETAAVAQADTGPVRLEQNWSTVAYEGVVVPDNRTPLRRFRRRVFERVRWIDPEGGTQMEMTVPHDEVLLIKATAH